MRWLGQLVLLSCLAACGSNAGQQSANESAGGPAPAAPAEPSEPTIGSGLLGFSFKQNGLTPRPYEELFNTALMTAYIDAKPGSFLTVEWDAPRDRKKYLSKLRGEMNSMGQKETSREQISFAGGKATCISFENGKGHKGQFVLQDAPDDQWFFSISCMAGGPNAAADYPVLRKAVDSFSTDMAGASGATHVDKVFGFHVTLAGFKNQPTAWKSMQPMGWELKSGNDDTGTLEARIVRREVEAAEYLKTYRDQLARQVRSMGEEKTVELAGRKGISLKSMTAVAGKQYHREEFVLCDASELAWHVVITWYGEDSSGSEARLRDTMLSLKLSAAN
ncbi:MAG: hypothetical protein IT464_15975 [Planctomycetes bacterium]|nr:hypothetical protein [Planctomycetota bacterium]